jgi:ribosome maturation factor RimP
MDIQSQIETLITTILPEECFLVEVQYVERKPTPRLTIILDGDKGIQIDVCAKVSRVIGEKIEELNLIPTAYNLEVSSPGVDKPLTLIRQYPQHIGRKLKIELQDGSTFTGTLQNIEADKLKFYPEKSGKTKKDESVESFEIAFNDVKKAIVLVSF